MSDVGIIDYGMGNIDSVGRAIEKLGYDPLFIKEPVALNDVAKIILPGVGAFPAAMQYLSQAGFIEVLQHQAITEKKPILGICLGMQIFADSGDEIEETQGLGLVPGRVVKLAPLHGERVPHVGWNEVDYKHDECLFSQIKTAADFYFVHSFYFASEEEYVLARTPYCGEIPVAVKNKNVWGVQFHPEKSQKFGLKLLQNFMEL